MQQNPYTLLFGRKPAQLISRQAQMTTILDSFTSENPTQQIYILTGVRGSGKTVLMTELSRSIAKAPDWITVELNPDRDMLTSLVAKLSSEHALAEVFKTARINLSFFGFGLEVQGVTPITDIEIALSKMLSSLQKQGKRVLVTVDEAANTQNMRIFASAFQIFIRQDLPLFLLMTGLYENIHSLQNAKTLTFLYRAPKVELKPLNIGTIAENYRKNLRVDDKKALQMAKLTKGYSFAFQVLGYFSWENNGMNDTVKSAFRQYLEDYVYEKIWSELSAKDRKIVRAIAQTPGGKILEIREKLGLETNQFNPYRKRLIQKGLVDGSMHGHLEFTLPLFDLFVMENTEDEL